MGRVTDTPNFQCSLLSILPFNPKFVMVSDTEEGSLLPSGCWEREEDDMALPWHDNSQQILLVGTQAEWQEVAHRGPSSEWVFPPKLMMHCY